MKKVTSFLLVALCQAYLVTAQMTTITDSSFIVSLNQQIDNLVIEQNTAALDSMYASDFVFSHGSGKIEGKQGWFISVAKGNFLTRQHDSVTVELHEGIAIVRGKLSVRKKNSSMISNYHLKYVRVYANRQKRWQLISHITTAEFHAPSESL